MISSIQLINRASLRIFIPLGRQRKKIRNPNIEIRNSAQKDKFELENPKRAPFGRLNICTQFWSFGFVSNFGLRISSFPRRCLRELAILEFVIQITHANFKYVWLNLERVFV